MPWADPTYLTKKTANTVSNAMLTATLTYFSVYGSTSTRASTLPKRKCNYRAAESSRNIIRRHWFGRRRAGGGFEDAAARKRASPDQEWPESFQLPTEAFPKTQKSNTKNGRCVGQVAPITIQLARFSGAASSKQQGARLPQASPPTCGYACVRG